MVMRFLGNAPYGMHDILTANWRFAARRGRRIPFGSLTMKSECLERQLRPTYCLELTGIVLTAQSPNCVTRGPSAGWAVEECYPFIPWTALSPRVSPNRLRDSPGAPPPSPYRSGVSS